ncbi:MAG: transcription elongation factor GreA [Bacteroidales bacterium]|nr:transcription elongation factor GreA [Bacteroidales bacterium]
MSDIRYYTEEGLQKLKDELNHLINVERPAISRQIAEARDKGDLSENAEYDAAKEAQGMLEMKISKLQELIRNVRVIDESKMDDSKILIMSTVKLKNSKTGASMKYTIVPEKEADIRAGKISVTSPIAKGLLGKKEGEKAEIEVPAGKLNLEIVEITREGS